MGLQLEIEGINDGARVPPDFAFGVPAADERMGLGPNRNPGLSWSSLPAGTRSLAVLCVDPDAPTVADDVNVEGRVIPADLPRADFHHWVLVDIDPSLGAIPAGAVSDGVTAGGKDCGPGPYGVSGINDYTSFLAADPDMAGTYGGYDGPCPPWNDERLHHYSFTLFALDVDSLGLSGEFTGPDAAAAMTGHVLEAANVTGTYTLNPEVA